MIHNPLVSYACGDVTLLIIILTWRVLGVIPLDTPEFAQGEHDISDTDILGALRSPTCGQME